MMWVNIHTVGPHPYILTVLQSFSIQYMALSEMRTNGIHRQHSHIYSQLVLKEYVTVYSEDQWCGSISKPLVLTHIYWHSCTHLAFNIWCCLRWGPIVFIAAQSTLTHQISFKSVNCVTFDEQKNCKLVQILAFGGFVSSLNLSHFSQHKLRYRFCVACTPAMLRAGIVFAGIWLCLCVALSVCPHKILKTIEQKMM